MKNAIIEEIISTWEVTAETEDGSNPSRRATYRQCADTLRMALTIPDEREKEMENLLRSACAIADRKGTDTAWTRFADSIRKLGLTGVTARTYRDLDSISPPQAQQVAQAIPVSPAVTDEFAPYLKEGETPIQRLKREIRDGNALLSLLAKSLRRFEFLHSTNKDVDGWEWGVARVRVAAGGHVEYLWGLSDHSDIDSAIVAQMAASEACSIQEEKEQ